MSRLGDLIKSQRTKYNMTPKQLARKCGVSEAFVLEVESGRKIPNDIIATRMLKAMGAVDTVMNDLNAETAVASMPAAPTYTPQIKKPKVQEPKVPQGEVSDTWKDALSGVIKRVPIYDSAHNLVGHNMIALEDGKVMGANPQNVFYFKVPDGTMRDIRICAGDLVLCIPQKGITHNSVMVFKLAGQYMVRRVKKVDGNKAELSWFESTVMTQTVNISDLSDIARAVKVEFAL